jgi:hypothetical protein
MWQVYLIKKQTGWRIADFSYMVDKIFPTFEEAFNYGKLVEQSFCLFEKGELVGYCKCEATSTGPHWIYEEPEFGKDYDPNS